MWQAHGHAMRGYDSPYAEMLMACSILMAAPSEG
jgi:hypothetical protein